MRTAARIIGGLIALLLVLVVIVLVNTWRLPALPPPQNGAQKPTVDADAAAQRLSQAIKIQTVSFRPDLPVNGPAFRALHQLLKDSFPRVHAAMQRQTVNDYSLLYTWPGSDKSLPPILITGHMDVVPIEPGTEGVWEQPPFSGAIVGGFIWGRGALDDKLSVLGALEAAEILLGQNYQPRRTILFAFGHDEEIGGNNGAKAIVDVIEKANIKPLFSIDEGSVILDGVVPGINRPIAAIGLAEKGYLSLELSATGKPGHSSMPPNQTAIGTLSKAIARLEANQSPATLSGTGGETFRALAPAMPFAMRAVIANDWLFSPVLIWALSQQNTTNALIRTTTAPTIFQAGVKDNVLPSEAKGVVNFRILPGETIATTSAHVDRAIADPLVKHAPMAGSGEPSAVADKNGPGYKLIADAALAIVPDAIAAPGLVVAGTDSKHYERVSQNAYRFTPVRLGPNDLGRIHASNERISVAGYGDLIAFNIVLFKAATQ